MRLELVQLDEAAGIDQELDALACGQLAFLVLLVDALLAAAQLGLRVERGQLLPRGQAREPLLPLRGGHAARRFRRRIAVLIVHRRGKPITAALPATIATRRRRAAPSPAARAGWACRRGPAQRPR